MSQDLAYLDATIADLEARRDHLNGMIESLKQIREQGAAPVAALGAAGAAGPEQEVRHDSFFGMTILDAIKKYLAMTKQTRSAPDIADALIRGGMKSAARDFVGNVRTTLSKNEEFVSVKNGEWGLTEWYPKRREPKATVKAKKRAKTKPGTATTAKVRTETPPVKLSPKDQLVWNHVKGQSGPFKPDQVAEALRFNVNTTRAALWRLTRVGRIQRAESGGYENIPA
jgi:hypothetical protein